MTAIHAFQNDALGYDDATTLAGRLQRKEVSVRELTEAAIARAQQVDPLLNAVQLACYEQAQQAATGPGNGVFAGIPTFIKDNLDIQGLPTQHGSLAFRAPPARRTNAFAKQLLAQGFVMLGKSRLPEFGFNASTEFATQPPTVNPWNPAYSCGASSGGAAALVAAGVVPIAHANDGGGSIRIPAAACGLVGMKPSRGRFVTGENVKILPLNIIAEGVVTRSVQDTAGFFVGMEKTWRNPQLPRIGEAVRPLEKRLRIGVARDSIVGPTRCADTLQALTQTTQLLESLGHQVEVIELGLDARFASDFTYYWGFLSFLLSQLVTPLLGSKRDSSQFEGLTIGLRRHFRQRLLTLPAILWRLRKVFHQYQALFAEMDVLMSPVLAHKTPLLGHLSPAQPFDELLAKLIDYVSFTPLHNVGGAPAISLPLAQTAEGLPLGVMFSAPVGGEKVLLELALQLEAASSFARIWETNTR